MNPTATGGLHGLPTPDDFDLLVDRFERAWRGGTAPRLEDFVPEAGEARARILEELVKIDLEYRWRSASAADMPLLEKYLDRYPELLRSGQPPIALVTEEYRVRRRWGDGPAAADYLPRFPTLTDLENCLQRVDAEIRAEGQTPKAGPIPGQSRYTRSRVHASGGLGRVWIAQDADLGREVALKELRPDVLNQSSLRKRFLQEARITGRLEHPGIVPVYELAEAPADDRPFYVMRFLRGRTLSEAARDFHRDRAAGQADPLARRSLLQAFVSVCNAVAYAHSRGVIHRDLKGANVLLGDFGEVIVLDWGLAKVLGEPGANAPGGSSPPGSPAPDRTLHGQVLGTPAYMSPEQAAGQTDRINERTDVFGLGAVLYEVLTGQPPYAGRDSAEVFSQARFGTVKPPSRVCRDVPPALDAVCCKALAFDQADRYASAVELAADVQRWLADEPVSAYREPWTVKMGRWARRHRTLVTSAAVFLLVSLVALTTGTVLLAREQSRTQDARSRAEANFRRALAVVDRFCTRVSEEQLLNEPGLQPLRKNLLGDAVEFYQEFVGDQAANPAVQAELARAHWRLGDLTEQIEPGDAALAHYRAATERLNALSLVEPANGQHAIDTAGVRSSLGNWHLRHGQLDEAQNAYREALELRQVLADASPDRTELRRDVGRSHINLGVLCREANRLEDAVQELEAARDVFRDLRQREPRVPEYAVELAWAHTSLGVVKRAKKDNRGAAQEHRQAIETLEALKGDRPAWRAAAAAAHVNLGELLRMTMQPAKAEPEYRKALELLEPLVRENPAVTAYRHDRARCWHNLAAALSARGRRTEAEVAYREAFDAFDRLAQKYPSMPVFSRELGQTGFNLASMLRRAGRKEDALPWYEKALSAFAKVGKDRPKDVTDMIVLAHSERGMVRQLLGRHAEASQDWIAVLELTGGQVLKEFRLAAVEALVRSGQYDRAMKEADLLKLDSLSGGDLYDLGALCSLASAAAAADTKMPEPERMTLAARHADRAVEMLEKSLQSGFLKEVRNAAQLRRDPDLDAIRRHPGFLRLLEKLPH